MGRTITSWTTLLFIPLVTMTAFARKTSSMQSVQIPIIGLIRKLALKPVGVMDTTKQLDVDIALPLRDQQGLDMLLQELYNPSSSKYQHYLTPSQFTSQFGPTQETYEALILYADANGFAITYTDPNRLTVGLRATVGKIQRAFGVRMMIYKRPGKTSEFYAPDGEPTVDFSYPLAGIFGLSNYFQSQPASLKYSRNATVSGSEGTGSGPNGSFWGLDFQKAYAPGVTIAGEGQAVGLLELYSGFDPTDISTYKTNTGLESNTQIDTHLCGGYGGGLGNYPNEVEDDIEMALAMAPGLDSIVVFEGDDPTSMNDVLAAMVGDSAIKQLSSSWLAGADYSYFLKMAADGQTFSMPRETQAHGSTTDPITCQLRSVTLR
jgi:kumamolisin